MLLHVGLLDWENREAGRRKRRCWLDPGALLMYRGRYQELLVNLTFCPTSYSQHHSCEEGDRSSNRVKSLICWFLNKLQYPEILCTVGVLPPFFFLNKCFTHDMEVIAIS